MAGFVSDNAEQIAQTVAVVVAVGAIWVLSVRVAARTVARMTERSPEAGARANTLWAMSRRLVVIVLVVVVVLMVAAVWKVPLTPLVALGSALGVAISFGAQSLVKDVISGFFILAEDQYQIGDVVKIAGVAGLVVDIRPRVTVLRDLDGNVHYIPNGQITVTSNLTQEFAQVVLDVGVAYKESVDRVIEVLSDELSILRNDDEWREKFLEDPQILGVETLGDSAVTVRAVMKVGADDRWLVRREAQRRVKNRLDAEGIEIPFPHLTVYQGEA